MGKKLSGKSEKKHYILGIDPGSIKTGYALIESKGKSFKVIKSGVIKLSSEKTFFKRLVKLKNEITYLIDGLEGFHVAIESLIYVKSVTSLAKLAQARGVILSVLGEATEEMHEYSPNLVKSAVSGYGLSSKQSVERALKFIFPKHEFATDDESDAMAIAICHSFHLQNGGSGVKFSKAGKSKSGGSSLKNALKHLEG